MLTYEQAEKLLGFKSHKALRYAEKLVNHKSQGYITVTRHDRPVVKIFADGTYQLDSCGYQTVTTKKTLNTYGPVQVYQEHFQWYIPVTDPFGPYPASKLARVPFRDGMLVNDLGQVYVNPETWDVVKLRKDS